MAKVSTGISYPLRRLSGVDMHQNLEADGKMRARTGQRFVVGAPFCGDIRYTCR